jgi:hypothetical protein
MQLSILSILFILFILSPSGDSISDSSPHHSNAGLNHPIPLESARGVAHSGRFAQF